MFIPDVFKTSHFQTMGMIPKGPSLQEFQNGYYYLQHSQSKNATQLATVRNKMMIDPKV